jgi:glutathione S-transferase
MSTFEIAGGRVRVLGLEAGFNAGELLGLDSYKNVKEWVARCEARPATQVRGGRPAYLGVRPPAF